MRSAPAAAVVAALGVLLAGCSAAPPLASPAAPAPAASVTQPASAEQFLTRHNLAGLTAEQIIDRLDASEEDRTAGPVGSVRPDELQLTDSAGGKASLPVSGDRFYLSVAPYLTKTHECFNHNLATCRGELATQPLHVRVTDAAGATLLDADITTYANGFAGLWLPRDITGTLTVTASGRSATTPIRTGAGDPTCLTTMQLQ